MLNKVACSASRILGVLATQVTYCIRITSKRLSKIGITPREDEKVRFRQYFTIYDQRLRKLGHHLKIQTSLGLINGLVNGRVSNSTFLADIWILDD